MSQWQSLETPTGRIRAWRAVTSPARAYARTVSPAPNFAGAGARAPGHAQHELVPAVAGGSGFRQRHTTQCRQVIGVVAGDGTATLEPARQVGQLEMREGIETIVAGESVYAYSRP